jgi:hypothetical protein
MVVFGWWFMVFNATFKNISVILWHSVLLVEETRVSAENCWPVASHWQTLLHNIVSSAPRHEWFRATNFSGDRRDPLCKRLRNSKNIRLSEDRSLPKSNRKFVETEAKWIPLTHIHHQKNKIFVYLHL